MGTGMGHASPPPPVPLLSTQGKTKAKPVSSWPSLSHGSGESLGEELVTLLALVPACTPPTGTVCAGPSSPPCVWGGSRRRACGRPKRVSPAPAPPGQQPPRRVNAQAASK